METTLFDCACCQEARPMSQYNIAIYADIPRAIWICDECMEAHGPQIVHIIE